VPASYDLSGKTAVVTGGARGIGRAISERLTKSGARVWVWDMNPVDLNDVNSAKVDVTSVEQIAQAIDQIVSHQLRIDILVNNAGYLGKLHSFD
jgi:3-oxoacyl-[acyl-carrier protein] reductase